MWQLLVTGAAPIVASLLTLILTQHHSRKVADAERVASSREEARKRRFEADESRYEDRRDAVIAFDKAVNAALDRITEFEDSAARSGYDLSPGDIDEEDPRYTEVNAARAAVVLLTNHDVAKAATELADALLDRHNGDRQAFKNAQETYQAASRDMLSSH